MAPRDTDNRPVIQAEEILAGIKRWVEIESPSHDAAAVNRMADEVERDLRRLFSGSSRSLPPADSAVNSYIAVRSAE